MTATANPLTVPPQRKGGRQRTNLTPEQLNALLVLDVVEAAALLRLSTDKIRQEIKKGTLSAENFGTPTRPLYRITREALNAYREARRVTAGGQ